ncbi:MFS transporter [Nonomuraea rubra]|uniref:MFS transporter n=1 Tax=Nonomuraea rubra TaxID=46180 RepID=UPI00361C1B7B
MAGGLLRLRHRLRRIGRLLPRRGGGHLALAPRTADVTGGPAGLGRRRPARIGPACLWRRGPAHDGPVPLRRWDVWRLALAGALLTVPQFAVLSFTAIFLHDVKGEDATLASVTVVIAQLGGGAARIWTGRRTDRTGTRRTHIRAIGTLAGLAMAGAAVLTDAPTPLTVTALALAGLLANSWHGVAYTEIAAMAGASRAGTALGLLGTTLFAMGFVTPLLIPLIITHASWAAVWALAAAASSSPSRWPLARREHAGEAGVGMRSESA